MTTPITIEAACAAPSSRTRPGAAVLFSTVEGMWLEYSVFRIFRAQQGGRQCGFSRFRVSQRDNRCAPGPVTALPPELGEMRFDRQFVPAVRRRNGRIPPNASLRKTGLGALA